MLVHGLQQINVMLGLVGLDLFNDDTRPSGHISCPIMIF